MGARVLGKLDLNISRWGNSLAVRLPAELARELGVGDGDTLHVERHANNTLTVSAQRGKKGFDKDAWAALARKHLASMPSSPSVMRALRDGARY